MGNNLAAKQPRHQTGVHGTEGMGQERINAYKSHA